jgi:hypothetical protein
MKQYIVTLTGNAESLTAGEVQTLLTEDLDWPVRDVQVDEYEDQPQS